MFAFHPVAVCTVLCRMIHGSSENSFAHLQCQKVMLGMIQLPWASDMTTRRNAWIKTNSVIGTICWTYSRRGRSKDIKAPSWSQHLRAMFKVWCEHKNKGVLFQTCSCGAFQHVPAKTSHNSSWMDEYCTCTIRQYKLRFKDKHRQHSHRDRTPPSPSPFLSFSHIYLKTHPLWNHSLLLNGKFNDSCRALCSSICYWQPLISVLSVFPHPVSEG